MYVIYILRCSDNSLYTGITNDFEKRYQTHFFKKKYAAKYTKSRQVVNLEALWETDTKSDALKLECRIKKLSKDKKEQIILNPELIYELCNAEENVYKYKNVKGM